MDINGYDTDSFSKDTPLMKASARGTLVFFLILQSYSMLTAFTKFRSLLGNEKMVELLINNGANVSQPNEYGRTPISFAIEYGITKILIQRI